jgi:hypothetical protein
VVDQPVERLEFVDLLEFEGSVDGARLGAALDVPVPLARFQGEDVVDGVVERGHRVVAQGVLDDHVPPQIEEVVVQGGRFVRCGRRGVLRRSHASRGILRYA